MKQSQTLKKVKLVFDSQFCGREETEVFVPADATEEYIKDLFYTVLGVPYNRECDYQVLREVEVDKWFQPDPSIDVSNMVAYGYNWAGMCPLRQVAAEIFFRQGKEVFLLYYDQSEAVASSVEEIRKHGENGGIFGVEVSDCE